MVTPVRTEGLGPPAKTGLGSDVRLLADDHALLLRGVQRRAASVLALAEARTWPYAELDTLTGFLRTVVLPHATDEEDRLYPDGVSARFAQLSAQHAHICAQECPPNEPVLILIDALCEDRTVQMRIGRARRAGSHPLVGSTIGKPTTSNARNAKCQRTERSTESW